MAGLGFGGEITTLFSLGWLVLGSVLLLLLVSSLYHLFIHPLSKVPGPKIYAISQLPYLYHLIKGDWHRVLREFHEEYGAVVRYSPRDVSFNSEDAFKKIYGQKAAGDRDYEKDHSFYIPRHPTAPTMVSASNSEHKRQRRLVAHAFSTKALSTQEPVLQYYSDLFVNSLGTHAKKEGGIVDIVQWYNFVTFDLIGELAFGKSFDCLKSGGYHPWVGQIFDSIKMFPYRQVFIRLNIATFATMIIPASVKRGAQEHREFSTLTALQRIETKDTTKEDFMSYILRYNDERGMSTDEITENAALIVLAGSETSSTLLSGVTYYILRHPDVYHKLTKEIRAAFNTEEEISLTRLSQLEYLVAVLNEGLRIYPPAPTSLPRQTPPGGDVIGGYWIPENTTVSVSQWTVFRSRSHFRDPDSFVPERWLGDTRYIDDNKDMFQPFLTGPRNCVGQNLAHAEMRLILTRLLWKFDLELENDSEDWTDQNVYVLWEKNPLKVRVSEVVRG